MYLWRLLLIYIVLYSALLAPAEAQKQAEIFPSRLQDRSVSDVSGQLSATYLAGIENQLRQYPFQVEVIYLPGTQHLNLGIYASKLFRHWKLPEDSMLVVVALDRRKIGVHAGTALKARLKQEQQTRELELPSAVPTQAASAEPAATGASPKASGLVPLDLAEGMDHLDLVPQAIDDLSESLRSETKASSRPDVSADPTEAMLSDDSLNGTTERGRRELNFALGDLIWLLALLLFAGLGTAGWFGFKFWRRWHRTQELVDRYSLQGQVVYEQLEQVYESLEAVMPDFHGYLGETEAKLKLFLKSIHHLQEAYESIFDQYQDEVRALSTRETREEAIDFFKELELKLEEGKQLHEQALTVLKNLKDVRASNHQLFEQADVRRQAFSQEISEIRKLHPALKLSKIQQAYQQALSELQRLDKQNERDPLGVEKKLKEWRKQLSRMEQETRSLPHLWEQFSGDLKSRIADLRSRIMPADLSSNRVQSLVEIERLHKTLLQAIEQGDLQALNRFNELFTRKLQQLEAEV
ncbi:MAG: hypothetical protein CVV27_09470 [Candidatus Melainabacteria bacterium HGW-Melainabacteria-1]|nr:MAG: hypothetical protein CVV27_09470 [Candidatus Melainabacteria bacterium HGW-Melainabacteria-1]